MGQDRPRIRGAGALKPGGQRIGGRSAGAQSVAGPPIRFAALVCGGWAVARAAILWPDAVAPDPVFAAAAPHRPPLAAPRHPGRSVAGAAAAFAHRPSAVEVLRSVRTDAVRVAASGARRAAPIPTDAPAMLASISPPTILARSPAARFAAVPPGAVAAATSPGGGGLRVEAALYLRPGGLRRPLEPGLGGSQAILGVRLPLARPLSATARLTSALDGGSVRQAEVALGLAARPVARLPIELVAERRVALSRDGRDAWQLRATGGAAVERGGWRLDGYGQGGVVGLAGRDLFADGQVRLSRSVAGPVRLGAVVAGAAQPGARRLDAGPHLRVDLAAGERAISLIADYRLRVGGNAAPASGPALTLATSF